MTVLKGVIAPLATPLDGAGRFDARVMEVLVERLIDDVDGVLVRGSSGEFPALRPSDADAALRTVVEVVAGRVPIVVGVGDTSTPRTLDQVEALGSLEIDCIAVTGTYYYPSSDADLVRHFTTVADHSPVPVLVYQIPQNTHTSLAPEALIELASHPGVVGVKDSSGDMVTFGGVMAARPPGFAVFQGREQLALPSIALGADGIISALGNIAPDMLRRLVAVTLAGDLTAARTLQAEVTELARLFDEGYWLSALKVALEEMGVPAGPPVRPAGRVTPEGRARIRRRLAAAGLVAEGST